MAWAVVLLFAVSLLEAACQTYRLRGENRCSSALSIPKPAVLVPSVFIIATIIVTVAMV